MKTLYFLSFLATLIIFSCNNANNPGQFAGETTITFSIDSARKEIDAANKQFIDLFNSSDSVGLANMFTSDGKSMEPNEPSFIGRAAIQTHYSHVMSAGANKLGLITTGLWGDEKMLAEEGEFTFNDKSGKQLDKGKYIVLWKMEDGEWKLFRDCYNSDLLLVH
jgi:ketosteroid isomerase-like protein